MLRLGLCESGEQGPWGSYIRAHYSGTGIELQESKYLPEAGVGVVGSII